MGQLIEVDEILLTNIEIDPAIVTRQSLYWKWKRQGLKAIQPDVQELADSMKGVGLLQPITVTVEAYKEYVLIIGLRRFLAPKVLKWKAITAQVVI